MLITFWSPVHGQCGTSTISALVACQMSLSNKVKILLSHTNFSHRFLEQCMLHKRELSTSHRSELTDNGIDGLIRLSSNRRLSPELIPNYTQVIIPNNRLDLLVGTRQQDNQIFESKIEDVKRLLELANDKYDMVFMDLNNGYDNKMTYELLKQSDYVITILNQNEHMIDQFITHPWFEELIKVKEGLVCLNHYSDEVRLSTQGIKRRLLGKRVSQLDHFPKLQDICNRSEILDFVFRNQQVARNQPESVCIRQLMEISNHIGTYMGIQSKREG